MSGNSTGFNDQTTADISQTRQTYQTEAMLDDDLLDEIRAIEDILGQRTVTISPKGDNYNEHQVVFIQFDATPQELNRISQSWGVSLEVYKPAAIEFQTPKITEQEFNA